MDSLPRFNYILVIIAFGVVFSASDFASASRKHLGSNSDKVELQDLSLPIFTDKHLENLNQELTFLKISNSKLESIDKFAFDGLTHLNFLDLSDSDIKNGIDPFTFSRLPGLEILVLKNLRLRNVRLNLTNVQELILSQNEIPELGFSNIVGKNVNYLDISSNDIEVLETGLESLPNLKIIDFSKNKVSRVGSKVFAKNPNIMNILASENRITSTDGLRLPQVRTLDLFFNRISSLNSDSFTGMSALEDLVLAFNSIRRLEHPFRGLIELKNLNLAWNELEELQADAFRDNLYLTRLSLQGNKLKSVEPFVSVLHHLTHLDLSHNKLETIREGFFSSLPSLKVLDLSFNDLKTVSGLFAPATELKVLNLAFNGISFNGGEFSTNSELYRLNLSSNVLDVGLSLFENNTKLTSLDLSYNKISNFCDADLDLDKLMRLSLRGNSINELPCLRGANFSSLCEVDIRSNPLSCGEELEDVVLNFVTRKSSPYQLSMEVQSDNQLTQCEALSLNRSIDLWNSVKRALCPLGRDVEVKATSERGEWESEESSTEEAPATPKKYFLYAPIGHLKTSDIKNRASKPQSERLSWEKIEERSELLDGLEDEEPEKKTRYSWYTITIVLIGLSLTLTCFNLAVFMYIRLKVWKRKDTATPQRYSILHNEVYKNTTEPTQGCEQEWLVDGPIKNKLFTYEKVNEFMVNFGGARKTKDAESAKNVLIDSRKS